MRDYLERNNASVSLNLSRYRSGQLTGICERNRFRVDIAEESSDWGEGNEHERAGGANDERVEDCGFLVRGPTHVAKGRRPELGGSHCYDRLGEDFADVRGLS